MAVEHLAQEVAARYLRQVEGEYVLLQVAQVGPFLAAEAHFGFIIVNLLVIISPLLFLKSLFVLPTLSFVELSLLFEFLCQCIGAYLLHL